MSSERPRLEHKDVIKALRALGFDAQPKKGTSHQHWKFSDSEGTLLHKVTVDEPKSPFGPVLVKSMASQAGLSVKRFYEACLNKKERKKEAAKYQKKKLKK
jgi:predicted RNA binding protein YcfA (HicA-like mRNA interferase family)